MDKERSQRTKRKRNDSTDSENDNVTQTLKFTEKIQLFNALIMHGSADISVLKSFMPTKNEEVIKKYVNFYKRIARNEIADGQADAAPIDKWLDYMAVDANKDREMHNDLSRALKYISLFETDDSMLRESYEILSVCMKGESPKHVNPVTSLFLYNNIQKLIRIYKTKNFERENKLLENVNKTVSCYPGKKTGETVDSVKIDPRISNPLKVSDSLLELKK